MLADLPTFDGEFWMQRRRTHRITEARPESARCVHQPWLALNPLDFHQCLHASHVLGSLGIWPVIATLSGKTAIPLSVTRTRMDVPGRHPNAYSPMSGSQLRYNVFAGEKLVACLSFGASA